MSSSPSPTTGNDPRPDGDVLAALALHREALRVGDAASLAGTVARGARRPSERDLLVDLIAAEGMEPAARKMSRFWANARTHTAAVRWISDDEVEVYEQLSLPGGPQELDVVTLLRRIETGDWQVVVTQRAPADVLRVKVLSTSPEPIRDGDVTREFTERYGRTGELILEEDIGVFGHPGRDWVASVTPASDGVEIALVPGADVITRAGQLAWLARVVQILAEHRGADRIFVPAARKIVGRETISAVADSDAPTSRALLFAWAGLHRNDKVCYTAGLCSFGLPETMAAFDEWPDPQTTRKVVGGAARGAVGGALKLIPSAVTLGGYRTIIGPGPRGPTPGATFGRLGAISLRPLRSVTVTESGVVERLRE
jgi:hypothetical protein